MQVQHGTLTIYGRACHVDHAALVVIPPSHRDSEYCLYLHADAQRTGGGFLMLDHLPVGNVTTLDDLRRACICFHGDDPDADDTVGSDPIDLATSGWTFPGYEEDESKNWHFESFRAEIHALDGNQFHVTARCELRNWMSDAALAGTADFVAEGRIGVAPLYDTATSTWSYRGEIHNSSEFHHE